MRINEFEILSLLNEDEHSLGSFLGYLHATDKDLVVAQAILLKFLERGLIGVGSNGKALEYEDARQLLTEKDNYKSYDIYAFTTKAGKDFYLNDPEVKKYFSKPN